MPGRRFWVVVLLTMALGAVAIAQDEKNELGGMIGRTFISNQGIQNLPNAVVAYGKGLSFEGEYARRFIVMPVYSLSGEVVAMVNYDEDVNGGVYGRPAVPPDLREFFITPAARLNLFPTTAVSPWVSFGVGFGHISQSGNLIYGSSNPGQAKTSATIEAGLGLDVKVWSKLSIRGEFRDFWSGEPDFPDAPTGKSRMHNYFVGAGAFWRF